MLSKEELDLARYEIEREWRRDAKAEGVGLIHKKRYEPVDGKKEVLEQALE